MLFLCFINDISNDISSDIGIFADDCVLYRAVSAQEVVRLGSNTYTYTNNDCAALQQDLNRLAHWSLEWGLHFNVSKCQFLRVCLSERRRFSPSRYTLNGQTIEEVEEATYLGVVFKNNLKWDAHIHKIATKASQRLGMLRRNIKEAPTRIKRRTYIGIVRSQLEYCSSIWDPYFLKDIKTLERIQGRAVHFITGNRTTSSTDLKFQQGLDDLTDRRKHHRHSVLQKFNTGNIEIPSLPSIDVHTIPWRVPQWRPNRQALQNSFFYRTVYESPYILECPVSPIRLPNG